MVNSTMINENGTAECSAAQRGWALTGLLPEETLPGGEVGALEERVLQDALHTAQRLDHVRPVVVQVPQLAVVPLVRPPERVHPPRTQANACEELPQQKWRCLCDLPEDVVLLP